MKTSIFIGRFQPEYIFLADAYERIFAVIEKDAGRAIADVSTVSSEDPSPEEDPYFGVNVTTAFLELTKKFTPIYTITEEGVEYSVVKITSYLYLVVNGEAGFTSVDIIRIE